MIVAPLRRQGFSGLVGADLSLYTSRTELEAGSKIKFGELADEGRLSNGTCLIGLAALIGAGEGLFP